MRIGMIGAGFIGRAVAQLALDAGHEVMISNSRGPETLTSIASGIMGCQTGTIEQAIAFGDCVLIAIPFSKIHTLPAKLLEGKIVIDANNYYPERDGQISVLDTHQTTTSSLLAAHLTGSKIVKAFNAILARDIDRDARPNTTADRRALPIAGDDSAAKTVVSQFINELGFDVVDAGSLADSWRFERAKPCYCISLKTDELKQAIAAAQRTVEVEHGSWRR